MLDIPTINTIINQEIQNLEIEVQKSKEGAIMYQKEIFANCQGD